MIDSASRAQTTRTYGLLALSVLLRPFGNLCLAWGMKHFPQVLAIRPSAYLGALLSPYVALGIGMLILAVLMRMALLSVADLSFVLPLTASGYIFSTLLGKFFLNEEVSAARWLGTLLIFVGIVVVGTTSQKTTHLDRRF